MTRLPQSFAFVAVFIPVLASLALMPVDLFGPPITPPGSASIVGTAPRCLTLRYSPPRTEIWLPALVRLDTVQIDPSDPRSGYLGAHLRDGEAFYPVFWWPVAVDSFDILGYRSRIRLPRGRAGRSEVLVGRAGPPGGHALFEHILAPTWSHQDVRASEVPCS